MKWVQGYLSIEYFKVIAALKQFKKVYLPALDNPSRDDTASLLSPSNIHKESYKRLVQNKASIYPFKSRGAILNIKFMTSFAENNLSSWGDISERWIHVFSSGAFGIL